MNTRGNSWPGWPVPILDHSLDEPTAFRPEDLVAAVREQRGAGNGSIPPMGVLEFDGDLTDKLITRDEVRRCRDWPCSGAPQIGRAHV